MYSKHIYISLTSLVIGLILIKHINYVWYSNIDPYLKSIANSGFRDVFFHNAFIALGIIIGLINGIGMRYKLGLIVIKLITGPLILGIAVGNLQKFEYLFYYFVPMMLSLIVSIYISIIISDRDEWTLNLD